MDHQIEGLDSKHLAAGSKLPPLAPDKLRLYNMRYCPYVQRTLLVLITKNIPFEVVNVNLERKPDWLMARNPLGQVPILEINNTIIYDSVDCNEFLEKKYPQIPILPLDETEIEKEKQLAGRLCAIDGTFWSWIFNSWDKSTANSIEKHLKFMEKSLLSDFFSGDRPGWADFMVWPWIERVDALSMTWHDRTVPNLSNFPKLLKYMERMKLQPAVKATIRDAGHQTKFWNGFAVGKYDYDFEIE